MLRHTPVLLPEVLDSLPSKCDTFLDGTLGHAGHTQALLTQVKSKGGSVKIVGVDRDVQMIEKAKAFLGDDADKVGIVQ